MFTPKSLEICQRLANIHTFTNPNGSKWQVTVHLASPPKKFLTTSTLPETNSFPLKMDGWKTILSFYDKRHIFRGDLVVSERVVHHHFQKTSESPTVFLIQNIISKNSFPKKNIIISTWMFPKIVVKPPKWMVKIMEIQTL